MIPSQPGRHARNQTSRVCTLVHERAVQDLATADRPGVRQPAQPGNHAVQSLPHKPNYAHTNGDP